MSFAFLYILNSLQSSLIVTYRSIHICQQLNLNPSGDPVPLKGLAHEIDFDNIDKNLRMLALISAAAGF